MNKNHDWLAELASKKELLQKRARIISCARRWFDWEGFTEFHAPRLVDSPGLEDNLEVFSTTLIPPRGEGDPAKVYLPTSPEFSMKKLLCAGYEKIYDLGVCFRNAEGSELHEPEFLMLEWYRAGCDERDIMRDCEEMINYAADQSECGCKIKFGGGECDLVRPWLKTTFADLFAKVKIDFREAVAACKRGDESELARRARAAGFDYVGESEDFESVFYKIFLTEFEPKLGFDRPVFVSGYPYFMSAYSKPDERDPLFSTRFELYICGVELANAFYEITDPEAQEDAERGLIEKRAVKGMETLPQDERFHEALRRGMPKSAGIAMGVDRLVMLLCGASSIQDVLAFYRTQREK